MGRSRPSTPLALRRRWAQTYAETPFDELPWFSRRPASVIVEAAEGRWWPRSSRLLDVGCGAGTNALYLAARGFRVSGIDLAEGAVAAARARAARKRLRADFRVGDALDLPFKDGTFSGAVDIGCFHTLPLHLRRAYSRELSRVIRPGGTHLLSWIAREHSGERGPPHRPSVEEVARSLEEEFLFLSTQFRPSDSGRPAFYYSRLVRRNAARPAAR